MDVTTPQTTEALEIYSAEGLENLKREFDNSTLRNTDLRKLPVGTLVYIITSIGSIYRIVVKETSNKRDGYWADVIVYCLRKADDKDFDLAAIVSQKACKNITVGHGWVTRDHRTNSIASILIR